MVTQMIRMEISALSGRSDAGLATLQSLGFDLLKRMSLPRSPTDGEEARPLMRYRRSLEEALKLKKQGECAINRSCLN